MSHIRVGLLLLAAISLSGCAGMSEEECLASDWRTVGYEDGVYGKSGASIGQYRKACAKAGVTPDLTAYQAGREEGLQEFCRPQNGYNVGVRGGHYQGVCPANLEPEFLDAYEDGRTLYELRADVIRIEKRIVATENEIEQLEDDMAAATLTMVSDEVTREDRLLILADTRQMAERRGELKDELEHLGYELGASRQRLDDYEAEQLAAY